MWTLDNKWDEPAVGVSGSTKATAKLTGLRPPYNVEEKDTICAEEHLLITLKNAGKQFIFSIAYSIANKRQSPNRLAAIGQRKAIVYTMYEAPRGKEDSGPLLDSLYDQVERIWAIISAHQAGLSIRKSLARPD